MEQVEKKTTRVVIADDHPVVRMGVRLMLEMGEGIELVGEAIDGAGAIELVAALQPDVILMDLRMPGIDGLEAIKRIRSACPQVGVLILTTYNEDDLMISGLRVGAQGYLLKDADMHMVIHAVRVAARGEMLVQPEIMARILSHAERGLSPPSATPRRQRHSTLTAREREVLAAVARGERSKEIAVRFGITERTVGACLTSVYSKLGVDSRAAAVAVALERGLLPRQE
ncbi:response regulator transcription factor [Dictyobacter formicarum]|uniref:Transcriptional regulatory protein YdfI n=1 Tax=Dictyobacter formicarum TaxID=2778368 RepID=A0ABQ3VL85_9CHLR|nr:response regulator transcription factor [Dictyobacter formicarum]GHO86969.1 transcriptional regulatory protein YdfI [Dictyobacter formicarum]